MCMAVCVESESESLQIRRKGDANVPNSCIHTLSLYFSLSLSLTSVRGCERVSET